MDEVMKDIVEVVEGGKKLANHYLDRGYTLLDVQMGARLQKFPEGDPNGRKYFIRRNPVYVLGRHRDVAQAPLPPRFSPPEKEKEEEHAGPDEG